MRPGSAPQRSGRDVATSANANSLRMAHGVRRIRCQGKCRRPWGSHRGLLGSPVTGRATIREYAAISQRSVSERTQVERVTGCRPSGDPTCASEQAPRRVCLTFAMQAEFWRRAREETAQRMRIWVGFGCARLCANGHWREHITAIAGTVALPYAKCGVALRSTSTDAGHLSCSRRARSLGGLLARGALFCAQVAVTRSV